MADHKTISRVVLYCEDSAGIPRDSTIAVEWSKVSCGGEENGPFLFYFHSANVIQDRETSVVLDQ